MTETGAKINNLMALTNACLAQQLPNLSHDDQVQVLKRLGPARFAKIASTHLLKRDFVQPNAIVSERMHNQPHLQSIFNNFDALFKLLALTREKKWYTGVYPKYEKREGKVPEHEKRWLGSVQVQLSKFNTTINKEKINKEKKVEIYRRLFAKVGIEHKGGIDFTFKAVGDSPWTPLEKALTELEAAQLHAYCQDLWKEHAETVIAEMMKQPVPAATAAAGKDFNNLEQASEGRVLGKRSLTKVSVVCEDAATWHDVQDVIVIQRKRFITDNSLQDVDKRTVSRTVLWKLKGIDFDGWFDATSGDSYSKRFKSIVKEAIKTSNPNDYAPEERSKMVDENLNVNIEAVREGCVLVSVSLTMADPVTLLELVHTLATEAKDKHSSLNSFIKSSMGNGIYLESTFDMYPLWRRGLDELCNAYRVHAWEPAREWLHKALCTLSPEQLENELTALAKHIAVSETDVVRLERGPQGAESDQSITSTGWEKVKVPNPHSNPHAHSMWAGQVDEDPPGIAKDPSMGDMLVEQSPSGGAGDGPVSHDAPAPTSAFVATTTPVPEGVAETGADIDALVALTDADLAQRLPKVSPVPKAQVLKGLGPTRLELELETRQRMEENDRFLIVWGIAGYLLLSCYYLWSTPERLLQYVLCGLLIFAIPVALLTYCKRSSEIG